MYEQRQVSSTSISLISDDEDDLFDSHGNEFEAYDEKKWTRAHLRVRTQIISFSCISIFIMVCSILMDAIKLNLLVNNMVVVY